MSTLSYFLVCFFHKKVKIHGENTLLCDTCKSSSDVEHERIKIENICQETGLRGLQLTQETKRWSGTWEANYDLLTSSDASTTQVVFTTAAHRRCKLSQLFTSFPLNN